MEQTKSPRQLFLELPEKIRDWLTSDQATYTVIAINERLGLTGQFLRIIPEIILQLVVKNIEPIDFIQRMSEELGVDFNSAKNIAKEIEEKILRPIEGPLRREADIDVKLIYFASPIVAKPATTPQPTPAQPIQTPIAIRVEPPVRQIPAPPPIPQSRPTFQPIRPSIVRLPINTPNKNLESSS